MLDKEVAYALGVCVDEEAELGEDSEPDVFRSKNKMVMRDVCIEGCVDEPVAGAFAWVNWGWHVGLRVSGGQDIFDHVVVIAISFVEKVSNGTNDVVIRSDGRGSKVRTGVERYGHDYGVRKVWISR